MDLDYRELRCSLPNGYFRICSIERGKKMRSFTDIHRAGNGVYENVAAI